MKLIQPANKIQQCMSPFTVKLFSIPEEMRCFHA